MLQSIMGASSSDTRIDISGMIGLPAESSVYKTMAAARDPPRPYGEAPSIWRGRPYMEKNVAMSIQSDIEAKLTGALSPERLEVINESHLHAGHHHPESGHQAVFDGAGETHFRVRIVAPSFTGMSRVERHRTVNGLLAGELEAGVHALAIEAAAPGEKTRW
jgi:BolA protein